MKKRDNERNLMQNKRHIKNTWIASIVNNQCNITETFQFHKRKQNSAGPAKVWIV